MAFGGVAVPVGVSFLRFDDAQSVQANAQFILPACTLIGIHVKVSAAPVGAETFVYRALKNGANAVFGDMTITGAAVSGQLTGSVAYASGDLISVRLTISAGAAVVNHQVLLVFGP
jgi:hypothetical protein